MRTLTMKVVVAAIKPEYFVTQDSKTTYWNGYVLWIRFYDPKKLEEV